LGGLRFRPADGLAADVIPFWDDELRQYHLFYLRGNSDASGWHRWQTPWAHIVSSDLRAWTEVPDALSPSTRRDPDGGACYTGSVIKVAGTWHVYYVGYCPGHPGGREQILHATSRNGIEFQKDHRPVIAPDGRRYAVGDDWRDPRVFWSEDEGCYCMTLTANRADPLCSTRKGVVVLATSADLRSWELKDPIYEPHTYPALECTDLFRLREWWYLLFSVYDGFTEYRYSRSIRGPWRRPRNPRLDGGTASCYAARTLFDGQRRLLFGWCGTLLDDRDSDSHQWGGDVVTPRELVSRADGELEVRCPSEFAPGTAAIPEAIVPAIGRWTQPDAGTCISDRSEGFAAALFEHHGVPGTLRCSIAATDRTGRVGILLHARDDLSEGYGIGWDVGLHLVELVRYRYEVGTSYRLPQVARPLARQLIVGPELASGDSAEPEISLLVFVAAGIIEVFIDSRYALTTRVADIKGDRCGLFTEDCGARFTDLFLGDRSVGG